jgi:outer membrane receptor protein involved in Fe transport
MMSCAVAALVCGTTGAAMADGIETVVVTAEHRTEDLQKVPGTVQAFTGETLTQLNVTDVESMLKYTPNVTYGHNGTGQGDIFMRGLSNGFRGDQSTGTIGLYPNVAIYLDEQSMQFPARNIDIYMVDMQRLEVLEGPQGTLFGGGAEAGALRYITNKPDVDNLTFHAEAGGGITSGGAPNGNFNATINVPVIDGKLAVRLTAYYDAQGGYIDNVHDIFKRSDLDPGNVLFGIPGTPNCPDGGAPGPAGCAPLNTPTADNAAMVKKDQNPVTHEGFRAQVQYDIDPDWNILISDSMQRLSANGLSVEYPIGSDFQKLKPLQITSFVPSFNKDSYNNLAWTLNGKIGDFSAIYTGGYTDRTINQQMDYTNYTRTYYGVYYSCTGGDTGFGPPGSQIRCYSPATSWHDRVHNTHVTEEARVSTPDDWRLRGLVGAYWEQTRIYDIMDFNYKTSPACTPAFLASQVAGDPPCLGNVETFPGAFANEPGLKGDHTAFGEDVKRGYTQTAIFGQFDFDILPGVLTATAGTRWFQYQEIERGSVYQTTTACTNVLVCPAPHGLRNDIDNYHDNKTFAGFKSHLGLTWHVDENTNAYFIYSEGYRPGGFNRVQKQVLNLNAGANPQFATPTSFAPDSLTNYEIGLKTALFDDNLQLNISVYDMRWNRAQFLLFQPLFTGNQTFAVNGPSYQVKGAELQFVGRPFDATTVSGSVSYNDNTEAAAPCLISNIPASATFGHCITSVNGGVNNYPNPFGVAGGVAAFSPKWQFNAHARHDWTFGDYLAFAQVGVSYTGKMFNQPANYVAGDTTLVPTTTYLRYEQPSYTTFDASVGVDWDKWHAEIFGENLGNSHASTFTSSAQWIKSEVPLRPRIVGVKIGVNY